MQDLQSTHPTQEIRPLHHADYRALTPQHGELDPTDQRFSLVVVSFVFWAVSLCPKIAGNFTYKYVYLNGLDVTENIDIHFKVSSAGTLRFVSSVKSIIVFFLASPFTPRQKACEGEPCGTYRYAVHKVARIPPPPCTM